MSSETAKTITKLVKETDKLVQDVLKDVARAKKIAEELKRLTSKEDAER